MRSHPYRCSHCERRDRILEDPHYRFCAACGLPRFYSESADRFCHADGVTPNLPCWLKLSAEQPFSTQKETCKTSV